MAKQLDFLSLMISPRKNAFVNGYEHTKTIANNVRLRAPDTIARTHAMAARKWSIFNKINRLYSFSSDPSRAHTSPTEEEPMPHYLKRQEIETALTISRATIYRWMKAGTFPLAIHLGANCVRWRASDIEAWKAEREGA